MINLTVNDFNSQYRVTVVSCCKNSESPQKEGRRVGDAMRNMKSMQEEYAPVKFKTIENVNNVAKNLSLETLALLFYDFIDGYAILEGIYAFIEDCDVLEEYSQVYEVAETIKDVLITIDAPNPHWYLEKFLNQGMRTNLVDWDCAQYPEFLESKEYREGLQAYADGYAMGFQDP